jgi:SAM-dependent methyltransferase
VTKTHVTDLPGRQRRDPHPADRSFLVHAHLSRLLRDAIEAHVEARGGRLGAVVDVGCGWKPYLPWIEDRCERYVGVDVGPWADVQGVSERLPIKDGVADLVLCTQVLEHVDNPVLCVAELGRVTRPGGVVLTSTHGVQPYHPVPDDYWRWTHAGLSKVFRENGDFEHVEVHACGGTIACMAYLGTLMLSLSGDRIAKRKLRIGRIAQPVISAAVSGLNRGAYALDKRIPAQQDGTKANALISNFLVVGTA